jgi:hypothetical protein
VLIVPSLSVDDVPSNVHASCAHDGAAIAAEGGELLGTEPPGPTTTLKAMPFDVATFDVAVAVPDAPAAAVLSPAAAAMRPEPLFTVCPRLAMPAGSVQPVAVAVLFAQNLTTVEPPDATFTDGAARVVADAEVMTDEPITVGTPALEYARTMRVDFVVELPNVDVTVDPAVPAIAVRVNTHERMSGVPSCCVPSNVQPAGVVAVVDRLTVTKYNSWSPTWTPAGIACDAVPPVPFELADARNATVPATAIGVTVFDSAEGVPDPTALTAETWSRYTVPLVKPVTTRLVAEGTAVRSTPTWVLVASSTTLMS